MIDYVSTSVKHAVGVYAHLNERLLSRCQFAICLLVLLRIEQDDFLSARVTLRNLAVRLSRQN